jgi:hypothetical protein
METHPIKRVIEPVAFYSGVAALLVLSAVIALYLAHVLLGLKKRRADLSPPSD